MIKTVKYVNMLYYTEASLGNRITKEIIYRFSDIEHTRHR